MKKMEMDSMATWQKQTLAYRLLRLKNDTVIFFIHLLPELSSSLSLGKDFSVSHYFNSERSSRVTCTATEMIPTIEMIPATEMTPNHHRNDPHHRNDTYSQSK